MKKYKFLLIAFMALILSETVHAQKTKTKSKTSPQNSSVFQCPMKCEGEKTYAKSGACPVCNRKLKSVTKSATYQCPMKCEGDKTYAKAGDCPVCSMKLKAVANTTAYQCPMKCEGEKTYAVAGKCPVCNMNLKATQVKAKAKSTTKDKTHNHSK